MPHVKEWGMLSFSFKYYVACGVSATMVPKDLNH
jgi:hypothetical protein